MKLFDILLHQSAIEAEESISKEIRKNNIRWFLIVAFILIIFLGREIIHHQIYH